MSGIITDIWIPCTGAGNCSVKKGNLLLNFSLGDTGFCTSNHRWLILFSLSWLSPRALWLCMIVLSRVGGWFAAAHRQIIGGSGYGEASQSPGILKSHTRGLPAVVGWGEAGSLIWWQFNLHSLPERTHSNTHWLFSYIARLYTHQCQTGFISRQRLPKSPKVSLKEEKKPSPSPSPSPFFLVLSFLVGTYLSLFLQRCPESTPVIA